MSRVDKLIIVAFNFFIKRLRKNIQIHSGGRYYLKDEFTRYECCYCKSHLTELSYFKSKKYGYEIQDIDLKYQSPETSESPFKTYGWVIEKKYTNVPEYGWSNMKPHKVYSSEKCAIDAVVQIEDVMKKNPYPYELRVRPVYHVDPVLDNRRILIKKILEK